MTTPLLVVDNLVRHFVVRRSLFGAPRATVRAVDGVSFTVAAGETLALVGESGCGKTTVSRLVLRLIEPTAGRVTFDGADVLSYDDVALRRFRRQAQLVFQDPYGSLNPRMTVGEILVEPLALHTKLASKQRGVRVRELLDMVGLPPVAARRYPHEFSGGQRQRVAIRSSSSATSRSRRSMSRSARRSSTCCATCSAGSASPTSSSRTISRW
jgi:ABC-type glutathione transport system ATPase component